MKILTIYVLSTFTKILAFVFPAFISLYLVVEFVERIDEFLQYQASMGTITLYLLFRIPIVGIQIGPLAILLSVALSVAVLNAAEKSLPSWRLALVPGVLFSPFSWGRSS